MTDTDADPGDPVASALPEFATTDAILPEAGDSDDADLPLRDDFFVTLQPVSLDFIAAQLDRLNVKYTRRPTVIAAGWEKFDVSYVIQSDDWLNVRATLRRTFPATAAAALAARCNWWNAGWAFLRAASTLTTGTLRTNSGDGEENGEDPGRVIPIAKVHLDLIVPLSAGIAPAQFQALHGDLIQNVLSFEKQARLGELIPESAWPWE